MKKLISILLLAAFTLLLSSMASATHYPMHSCAISTGHGLLPDVDCDQVPDFKDNCPYTPNQRQADSDRDGIGDACEAQYEQETSYRADQPDMSRRTAERTTVRETVRQGLQAEVQVMEIQDVYAGGPGAVYPIKITSNEDSGKRFFLEVNGIQFGTYRIDPGNVMVIDEGQARTAYLHILADEDIEEESYTFTLTITADGESKTVTLTANVLEQEEGINWQEVGEVLGWIVAVIAILILLFLLAGKLRNWGKMNVKEGKRKDRDMYSYY